MFILAHVFRVFSSWSLGSIVFWFCDEEVHHRGRKWWSKAAYLMSVREQRESKVRA
jgi:hypothetical protein